MGSRRYLLPFIPESLTKRTRFSGLVSVIRRVLFAGTRVI
jgi:hypothetical protein